MSLIMIIPNIHKDLVNKIVSSGYFSLKDYSATFPQALHSIELDKADLILEIPIHFEQQSGER